MLAANGGCGRWDTGRPQESGADLLNWCLAFERILQLLPAYVSKNIMARGLLSWRGLAPRTLKRWFAGAALRFFFRTQVRSHDLPDDFRVIADLEIVGSLTAPPLPH